MVTVVGIDPSKVKKKSCNNCASVLEYTESEIKRVDGKDYSGGADGYTYITCPKCGHDVKLTVW